MRGILAGRFGIFLLGFLIFVLFRLAYGYVAYPNGEPLGQGGFNQQGAAILDFELSRRNYAGQKKSGSVGALPQALDQRYEKIAVLGLNTHEFDEDEAQVRSVAKEAGALIQFEQAHGLAGARRLQLALGVPPDKFDAVIASLTQIGKQVSFQVNKTDKTNEYRSLLARQSSLEKSRDSLMALKSREAELSALISLESSILDLERQIQDLGVAVGEFDSEFEFVTVKLVMSEVPEAKLRDIALIARVKTALEWAVKWYLALNAALFVFLGVAFFGTRLAAMATKTKA